MNHRLPLLEVYLLNDYPESKILKHLIEHRYSHSFSEEQLRSLLDKENVFFMLSSDAWSVNIKFYRGTLDIDFVIEDPDLATEYYLLK